MTNTRPVVMGVSLDPQTRCTHYYSPLDIIAIKLKCCGTFYACKDCHDVLADHAIVIWPCQEWDERPCFAERAATN